MTLWPTGLRPSRGCSPCSPGTPLALSCHRPSLPPSARIHGRARAAATRPRHCRPGYVSHPRGPTNTQSASPLPSTPPRPLHSSLEFFLARHSHHGPLPLPAKIQASGALPLHSATTTDLHLHHRSRPAAPFFLQCLVTCFPSSVDATLQHGKALLVHGLTGERVPSRRVRLIPLSTRWQELGQSGRAAEGRHRSTRLLSVPWASTWLKMTTPLPMGPARWPHALTQLTR